MLTVSKFGGSSLAGADGLDRVSDICARTLREGSSLAVVVSARGDTTDELLAEARAAAVCPHPRELDAMLSTGELRSAAALAMRLKAMGINAVSLTGAQAGIKTTGRYGDAQILSIDTSMVNSLISLGKVPVICGFQGADEAGNITTLGRGGSDTTAVYMAAALSADLCRIYTDVDGVFTADPRTVPEARLIPAVDLCDMLTLARFGCGVLHPRAAECAMAGNVPLTVLSSFSGSAGTEIKQLPHSRRPDFAGIAAEPEGNVTIVGKSAVFPLKEQVEYALWREHFTVTAIKCGENFIRVTLPPEELTAAVRFLHSELFG